MLKSTEETHGRVLNLNKLTPLTWRYHKFISGKAMRHRRQCNNFFKSIARVDKNISDFQPIYPFHGEIGLQEKVILRKFNIRVMSLISRHYQKKGEPTLMSRHFYISRPSQRLYRKLFKRQETSSYTNPNPRWCPLY